MNSITKIIGIGEYAVSNNSDEIIKTFALGSCVAMTAYCPANRITGMVHIALPGGKFFAEKCPSKQGYYAVDAVPLVINEMCLRRGCARAGLIIELFGGADSLRENDKFQIGLKNVMAVRSLLAKLGLRSTAEKIGGTYSRTVQIEVATGRTSVVKHRMII